MAFTPEGFRVNPPPKPRSENIHPEIAHLPHLTPWRRLARHVLRSLLRLAMWLFTDVLVRGVENFPVTGPALVVSNHLGDADVIIGVALAPRLPEVMAKVEMVDFPVIGKLMEAYGVIWVHRGQPDRRALRAALQGLSEGRLVSLAPEGRESLTGSLEEGTGGAAFLALKANAPVLPVTFTSTENSRVYGNMKRFRRTSITVTVGPLFHLQASDDRRHDIQQGTQTIMSTLASQLPPEYQGVYQNGLESSL